MSNNEKWSKNGPKTVFTNRIGISDSRLLLAGSLWKCVQLSMPIQVWSSMKACKITHEGLTVIASLYTHFSGFLEFETPWIPVPSQFC